MTLPRIHLPMTPSSCRADSAPVAASTSISSLASGWEERKTEDGRTYYVDHARRVTQWNHPSVERDHPSTHDTSSALPMPVGWEQRINAAGRTYYVDHIRRVAQWDHPSRPAVPVLAEENVAPSIEKELAQDAARWESGARALHDAAVALLESELDDASPEPTVPSSRKRVRVLVDDGWVSMDDDSEWEDFE